MSVARQPKRTDNTHLRLSCVYCEVQDGQEAKEVVGTRIKPDTPVTDDREQKDTEEEVGQSHD